MAWAWWAWQRIPRGMGRQEHQENPQAGMNRARMQRKDKPSAHPLALFVPPGDERGQKARNCQEFSGIVMNSQEFSGEKDSTAEGGENFQVNQWV